MSENMYNLNIERAVLSAIIFDPQIFEEIASKLQSHDFYLPLHQHVFTEMEELLREDKPIDEEFLKTKLHAKGNFDEVALLDILSANPISNTNAYLDEIKARSSKRSLVTLATTIKKVTIEDDLPVEDVMNMVEKKLYEITQNSTSDDFRESKEITLSMLSDMERLKALGNSKLLGIDTGFRNLNDKTQGFGKGDLIIIAARPAMGKCFQEGTKLLMYSGELKKVENITVGEQLMGNDSTPRKVLSLARGREEMYWIRQNKGIDYRVNKSHILSLKHSRNGGKHKNGDVLNISVEEYLKTSDKFKTNYKGYKVGVEFSEKKVEIEPYFLGLWLGDGNSNSAQITNTDKEIDIYLKDLANNLDIPLTIGILNKNPAHKRYKLHRTKNSKKSILEENINQLNLFNNKHIPKNYLINSRKNRLELLAGLIDSDGHYDDKHHVIEITQKLKQLSKQIKFLADSLGFRCSFKSKIARIKSIGYECEVYCVRIVGNLDEIPTKIARKKARPLASNRNHQHTGIKVEYDKVDDYYGFEIDGNRLFLLEDMTVTHNTSLVLNMTQKAIERNEGVAFFSLEMPAEQLMLRLLSTETSIPLQDLRIGNLTDDEWTRLSKATDRMVNRKLFVDDAGFATINQVRSKLRKLKSQHPEITMAVIDYLQLMSGNSGREGRQQEISEISRGLKQLARELQIPIIALSQLNRGVESRDNKRPMLSDLRESGSIEQDADIVMFVYRDAVYREAAEKEKEMKAKNAKIEGKNEEYTSTFQPKEEEETELIIGKQRNGPTGTVDLIFQKKFTRFIDAHYGNEAPFEMIYEEDGNMDTRDMGNIDFPPPF
ncbi:MAG TPA: replicative DNA helicase [Campylobacterales bacterium]|nr:replicative DNA helicase [Campylobacterales bacterium]